VRRYKQTRISFPKNEKIFGSEFRVIDQQGENLGVLSREEAQKRANDLELDLVLVAPKANPPVVRIIEYDKYVYEQQKVQSQLKKKQRQGGEMKQFRFKPNIDDNDLMVRAKRIKGFLDKGSNIKIIIPFYGRIITHKQLGYDKIDAVMTEIGDSGEFEREPKMEGKLLIAYIKPK